MHTNIDRNTLRCSRNLIQLFESCTTDTLYFYIQPEDNAPNPRPFYVFGIDTYYASAQVDTFFETGRAEALTSNLPFWRNATMGEIEAEGFNTEIWTMGNMGNRHCGNLVFEILSGGTVRIGDTANLRHLGRRMIEAMLKNLLQSMSKGAFGAIMEGEGK